jgi:hypothetical protein
MMSVCLRVHKSTENDWVIGGGGGGGWVLAFVNELVLDAHPCSAHMVLAVYKQYKTERMSDFG